MLCIYVISLVAYTGNFELEYWCMKNGFEKKKKWRRFVGDTHCLYSVILNLEFPVLHATYTGIIHWLYVKVATKYLSCFITEKQKNLPNINQ